MTPPKNYVERRANCLRQEPCDRNIESNKNVVGFYGTTAKEYDEYAVFDLQEFIEDISTNNADKHIVGFYEDRVGTCKNINLRDGPSGQGTR